MGSDEHLSHDLGIGGGNGCSRGDVAPGHDQYVAGHGRVDVPKRVSFGAGGDFDGGDRAGCDATEQTRCGGPGIAGFAGGYDADANRQSCPRVANLLCSALKFAWSVTDMQPISLNIWPIKPRPRSISKDERMQKRTVVTAVALGILAMVGMASLLPVVSGRGSQDPGARHLFPSPPLRPVAFEPNHGQVNSPARFVARGEDFAAQFMPTEAVIAIGQGRRSDRVIGLRPVDANGNPRLWASSATGAATTYLRGRSQSESVSVPNYRTVTYGDIYPGIDLVFRDNEGRLQHDFVVAPGSDPESISVQVTGSDGLSITTDGALSVLMAGAEAVRFAAPELYQRIDGARRPVGGRFRIQGPDRMAFEVDDYNPRHPLVIDPTLLASTYLGGGADDNPTSVAVDQAGNVYIAGFTVSGDFPLITPAQTELNTINPGSEDAFVVKMSGDGKRLIWSTYLGGKGSDRANAIKVGADQSVFLAGTTASDDFPRGPGAPPPPGDFGGGTGDAFVARLKPDGSALIFSKFVGGVGADEGNGLGLDGAGNMFVAGSTNSVNFPNLNGLVPPPPETSGVDAFVVKLNAAGDAIAYSSRLGGSGVDSASAIAVAGDGSVTLVGTTGSPEFPNVKSLQTFGAATGQAGSESDAFVAKIDPAGSGLLFSTFLGGSSIDQGAAVALDDQASIYVAGVTSSPDFPTERPLQGERSGESDAFVTKLAADGSRMIYSTYFGGSGDEGASGIALGAQRQLWVVGTTGSADFETARPIQREAAGGKLEMFVVTFNEPGDVLESSSYLGGRGVDLGGAIAMANDNLAVVVGTTDSTDFPAAEGVEKLQVSIAGATDGFFALISGSGGLMAATTGSHERRVQLLVVTTVVLFLIAVFQTLHLRRHAGRDEGWRLPVGLPGQAAQLPGYSERGDSAAIARSSGIPVDMLTHDVPVTAFESDDDFFATSPPATAAEATGFLEQGYEPANPAYYDPQISPQSASDQTGYDQTGYDETGYEQPGYDQPGYDQGNYAAEGFGAAGEAGAPMDDTGFWDLFPDDVPSEPEQLEPPAELEWNYDLEASAPPAAPPAGPVIVPSAARASDLWAPSATSDSGAMHPDAGSDELVVEPVVEPVAEPVAAAAPPAAAPISQPPAPTAPAAVSPYAPAPIAADQPLPATPPAEAPSFPVVASIEAEPSRSDASAALAPIPAPTPTPADLAAEALRLAMKRDPERAVEEFMAVDFGPTGQVPSLTPEILAVQWDMDEVAADPADDLDFELDAIDEEAVDPERAITGPELGASIESPADPDRPYRATPVTTTTPAFTPPTDSTDPSLQSPGTKTEDLGPDAAPDTPSPDQAGQAVGPERPSEREAPPTDDAAGAPRESELSAGAEADPTGAPRRWWKDRRSSKPPTF